MPYVNPWAVGTERVLEVTAAGAAVRVNCFDAPAVASATATRPAPVVVLVHGLGGAWQHWYANIGPLAEAGSHVVAVDLPGFGRSEILAGETSIGGYADLVEAVVGRLGLTDRPAVLVGNSMGGFIAVEAALRRPARVGGLVLAAAAGMGVRDLWNGYVPALARSPLPLAMPLLFSTTSRVARAVVARPRLRALVLRDIVGDPEHVDRLAMLEAVRGSGHPVGYARALRAIVDYDFREALEDVATPALIVQGDADRLVPVEHARRYRRALTRSRLSSGRASATCPSSRTTSASTRPSRRSSTR